MAGRRELERRLHALDDIGAILGVMKNLALMETGKLSRILVAQRVMVESLEATATDYLTFYSQPYSESATPCEIVLLVGSQRGFCGDFNDLIITAERGMQDVHKPLRIVVGDKLVGRLAADIQLSGPHAVEEIGQVIHQVMDAVSTLLRRADGGRTLLLSALCHDPVSGTVVLRSLAPFIPQSLSPASSALFPPHLNIAPAAFYAQLAEQHLLAAITEMFHRSLMAESRFRLNHIEGASRRMERRSTELKRKQTLARQEEIIEEIEAILAGAGLDETEEMDVTTITIKAEKNDDCRT